MEIMIDFLIRLITPTEGVDYALAPIVLAALTQVPGLIQGVSAANAASDQAKRDEARAKRDKDAASRALSSLKAGKLEFAPAKDMLANRYTEAYDMAMSRAPELAAREAREMALATALSTGGDPRAQAANMMQALNFASQSGNDALRGLQGRIRATESLAGQEQSVIDANIDKYNKRFYEELGQAQQLFTMSRAQEEAAQDAAIEAKRQKNQAIIGAGVNTLTGALTTRGVNKFGDIFKSVPGALDGMGGSTSMSDFAGMDFGTMSAGIDTSDPMYGSIPQLAGNINFNAHGGKVGKTGGEFSHATNKKALIDEESGEKEAELTGNETMFVFNPKQTSTFEKLVRGDDAKGLMKFMKQLLKKPQFNK
jgi:hypothetical protein